VRGDGTMSVICEFWKSHPKFWFPATDAERGVADREIYDRFYAYDLSECNIVERIIYQDQFMRHFQRIVGKGVINDSMILYGRLEAVDHVNAEHEYVIGLSEWEFVWCMMPFKHVKEYDKMFRHIDVWVKRRGGVIKDYPLLASFFMDSYKKAFTIDRIGGDIVYYKNDVPVQRGALTYDPETVCEYHPEEGVAITVEGAVIDRLIKKLNLYAYHIGVSLSGGVDSMVLAGLLKRKGVSVKAIHIVYGNREESYEEMEFVKGFCREVGIPLYIYRIWGLRRSDVDREFYEKMTRDIRFMVYKAIGSVPVVLGHIQDDVVENVWTNIANAQHIHNLKKMEEWSVEAGVQIWRPFLNVEKKDVYECSRLMRIPYLKNTTPSWSNRGKFRETFHGEVVKQYGAGIDAKIIEFADAVTRQMTMLDKILYDPIYRSYDADDRDMDITRAVEAGLDVAGWKRIFEHMSHIVIKCNKPSVHAVRSFCNGLERLVNGKRGDNRFNINLNKNLSVRVIKTVFDSGSVWYKMIFL
jgi:tRNA(Ile)-lysidine synthetase-like protein